MPLVLLGVVVVVTVAGFSRGWWVSNLHNGLLALSLAGVGAYVLRQRPAHREGTLLMAAGLVEGVVFLGRQVAHGAAAGTHAWWGWLGVWPVALALGVTTLAVVCFPDGRLPSPRWRPVVGLVAVVVVGCTALSMLWPVENAAAGVPTEHPWAATTPDAVSTVWNAVAHPSYAALQLLWVVALVARWRSSDGGVRRQLAWVAGAAAVSLVALVLGLVVGGTPVPGLLLVPLVPVAAGWAIVHGQHAAAYAALTWLSRRGPASDDLASEFAAAVAQALSAPAATLWVGSEEDLRAVGVWPATDARVPSSSLASLRATTGVVVRAVATDAVVGALTVERPAGDGLSLAEERLLTDLAAHGALVVQHLGLADVAARQRVAEHLETLTAREREVLRLMARGLSNGAICEELHLSVKTVEPVVSSIFAKLGLHPDATSNRRVLAVLAFVGSQAPTTSGPVLSAARPTVDP